MSTLDPLVRQTLIELRAQAVALLDRAEQIEEEIARLIGDDEFCRYATGFVRSPAMTPGDLWANRESFEATP